MAKHYESDVTQFIKQFKQQHPDVEQRQREGRAKLWDKHIDPELQEQFRGARLSQRPYVYQND
ncbi:DUF3460 family protein [Pusillimonas sp. CC-YST705]|uniref:DUF3460 family protein n=1 Tax=Mesopusillimonas faecipullorum TaxID=2755040 RepID=A0ABS8C9J6_9BURK|nr:DUF3460 family protein [Mesopusillimonas faecipullorum]MCB5362695.1 DUF3460 family protein [Mesopusillimonas faecipullorum]